MKKLTDKQKRFCEEYLIDFNATQAAIRAGYSEKTARSIGNNLLTKVDIQNYIKTNQDKTSKKLEITRESLLGDLKQLQDTYQGEGLKALSHVLKSIELQGRIIGAFTENIKHSGDLDININLSDD